MNLTIDIETIPNQTPGAQDDIAVSPPANIKKQESIDKWMGEKAEDAREDKWLKSSFDGGLGEIICVAYAVDDAEPVCIGRSLGDSERDMLIALTDALRPIIRSSNTAPIWIGHYITGFDLRFLWKRYVINQLNPRFHIPYDAKPWDRAVYDTCIEWAGLRGSGISSLDDVSKAMGFEGKGDIDGSQVWDYIKAGRHEEVFEYCKDDVNKTRNLYNRMTFNEG